MRTKVLLGLIIGGIILVDQALKIWVKTSFYLGQEMELFGHERLLLLFVENDGMAFGLNFGGEDGKLLLTVFRLLAIFLLGIYLRNLLKEDNVNRSYLFGFALILGGAIGNSIDSTLYGVLFSESMYGGGIAEWMPAEGGYAPIFYGRVVDMFFFPLFRGVYPQWLPLVGGSNYLFFKPIFNLADVTICLGVIQLLWIQLKLGRRATKSVENNSH